MTKKKPNAPTNQPKVVDCGIPNVANFKHKKTGISLNMEAMYGHKGELLWLLSADAHDKEVIVELCDEEEGFRVRCGSHDIQRAKLVMEAFDMLVDAIKSLCPGNSFPVKN